MVLEDHREKGTLISNRTGILLPSYAIAGIIHTTQRQICALSSPGREMLRGTNIFKIVFIHLFLHVTSPNLVITQNPAYVFQIKLKDAAYESKRICNHRSCVVTVMARGLDKTFFMK